MLIFRGCNCVRRKRAQKSLNKILEEEFDIHSEAELNDAIAALPAINLVPFCTPVNSQASAGQSTDSLQDAPRDGPTDYPMEGHGDNPRKIRL